MWNSTRDIMHYMDPAYIGGMGNMWEWRPQQTPFMDWKWGVQWNCTNEPILRDSLNGMLSIQKVVPDTGVILMESGSFATPQNWQYEAGFSMLDGHNLWIQNRTLPIGSTTWDSTVMLSSSKRSLHRIRRKPNVMVRLQPPHWQPTVGSNPTLSISLWLLLLARQCCVRFALGTRLRRICSCLQHNHRAESLGLLYWKQRNQHSLWYMATQQPRTHERWTRW